MVYVFIFLKLLGLQIPVEEAYPSQVEVADLLEVLGQNLVEVEVLLEV
jgi:hypothetical protein